MFLHDCRVLTKTQPNPRDIAPLKERCCSAEITKFCLLTDFRVIAKYTTNLDKMILLSTTEPVVWRNSELLQ